jgi:hypothetical protein
LTNRVNDTLLLRTRLNVAIPAMIQGVPEAGVFGSVPGGNGVDLYGFAIDRIGLRLDALTFVSPPIPGVLLTQYSATSDRLVVHREL